MRIGLFSCALTLALCAEVAAQETQEGLGARATATRQTFERTRGADHVTRTEADERGAGNAAGMLEGAHGVSVQRTSSGSGTPIVRGLTGYQVLLMVDDIRLSDALTRAGGSASLNLIDAESIRDIEVIRGPASVLYGSDALGGVVHVRTQSPGATPDAETDAGASIYGRSASAERALSVQGSARLTSGNFGAFVSGGRGGSGLINRGGDLGVQSFTGHEDWSFASRLELVHTLDHRVALSQQSGHLFDMPRSDTSTPDDVQITTALDRDAAVASYDGRLYDGVLKLHAYAGLVRKTEHRTRIREDVGFERDQVVSYHLGVRGSGAPYGGGGLEVGLESTIEAIDSDASTLDAMSGAFVPEARGRYVDDSLYQQHALYGLLTHALATDWTLLAGARVTLVYASAPRDPLFASLPSADAELDRMFVGPIASIGVQFQVSSALSWVASALGGFRAPNLEDFQAFGGGARGFTIPNQELSEERSYTLETGVELDDDERWRASAYVFGSVLDGLIVRVPSSLSGMTEIDGEAVLARRNASTGYLVGAEAEVLYKLDFGLYGGPGLWLTWGQTTRPTDTGGELTEPASKLPGPTGVLRVGYASQRSPWFAEGVLTGQLTQRRLSEGDKNDVRLCAEPETCTRVPGYTELTLRGGVRMEDHILITLAIENLFDAGYRTYASGAYAPGRNFVAAVRGTL